MSQEIHKSPTQHHPSAYFERAEKNGWFMEPGAYCLLDGQYGSTGKGLAEQALAALGGHRIGRVITNAGPNSGHTIYHPSTGEKIVTKQVPSFSIAMEQRGMPIPLHLSAGAMIDPAILREELVYIPDTPLTVSPWAAAILPKHYSARSSLASIASTQKGTGPALADKVMRERFAVVSECHDFMDYPLSNSTPPKEERIFLSTAQGFSLGLNSGFYPYTTCRDCSVAQALNDARIPPKWLRKVIMTYRAFPIRVGSTAEGSSGGCYSDQRELDWGTLGVEPELTTVTQRQRRIFTWSNQQFVDGLVVNEPDALFLNFLNYFHNPERAVEFVRDCVILFDRVRGKVPDFLLLGFGSHLQDIAISYTMEEIERDIRVRFN